MNPGDNLPSNTESTNPSFGEKVTFGSKREKFMVDIRRQSRQNILNRKRFMKKRDPNFNNYKNDPYDYLRLEPEGEKIVDLINETVNSSFDPTEINKYVQMIRSGNRLEKIVGIIKLRLVLSIPKNTPIQAVIDTNIASELLRIIKEKEEDYLRIEATWALTNLATGTNLQVQSLVDKGIIPVYVKILEENNINLIEQAVWGIGNLAGDCIQFRDELLQNNAMLQFSKLYERVKGSAKRTFINQLTWAASNLCRLKPVPEITMIASGIGMFCEGFKSGIIKASNDSNGEETQVIIDSIWAISQITSPFTIKAIAGYGILPYIMEILKSDQIIVVHPCLRIIGAYCSSSDDLCQEVISNDGISRVGSHLASTNPNIRKEACWILSNISAGTSEQIQELLNEKGVMEKLFSIASNDITSVKREAVWTICNLTRNMSQQQMEYLLKEGILQMFSSILTVDQDSKMVNVVLEGLNEFITKSKDVSPDGDSNPLLVTMEDMGLTDQISEIQNHPSESVYKKASKILTDNWDIDDEDW